MQNWQPTNPVERRLMDAHADWLDFARNKPARLLYWQTDEADQELVNLYFQLQQETSSAVFCLDAEFESARQYPRALADAIIAFYDTHREGSAAQGITADWRPPPRDGETDTHYLLKVASSLIKHHPDVFPGMVLVLEPAHIKDAKAFERWLDTLLADLHTPPWQTDRIRVVLHGTEEAPLTWLRKQRPQQVQVVHGVYHMQAVPRELVADSGERGPSGQFRRLFVELGETISHNDPARLERLRSAALEVTGQAKWPDQSVVVHLLAGAAYLKWQDPKSALGAYEQATASGKTALAAAHPAGNKLVANGLFGEASVHLTRHDYALAARCYEQAAAYTLADKDGILTVEAWRMHSFCLDKLHHDNAAIDSGFKALAAGLMVDAPLRANSNLPLVTTWMLRQVGFFHKRRGELNDHLTRLYGKDWPDTIKPLAPEDVSTQLMDQSGQGTA